MVSNITLNSHLCPKMSAALRHQRISLLILHAFSKAPGSFSVTPQPPLWLVLLLWTTLVWNAEQWLYHTRNTAPYTADFVVVPGVKTVIAMGFLKTGRASKATTCFSVFNLDVICRGRSGSRNNGEKGLCLLPRRPRLECDILRTIRESSCS